MCKPLQALALAALTATACASGTRPTLVVQRPQATVPEALVRCLKTMSRWQGYTTRAPQDTEASLALYAQHSSPPLKVGPRGEEAAGGKWAKERCCVRQSAAQHQ